MSRQRDRDEFIALMAMEGVGVDVARKLIRAGATLHWLAELECSSEAADRDRIPCPGERRSAECLCEHWSGCGCPETAAGALVGAGHHKVTRISVHGQRVERRVRALCATVGLVPVFRGDPRGAVLTVKVPSGRVCAP